MYRERESACGHFLLTVPHWGYLVEGSWTVGYTETGCLIVEFSPAAENAAFMEEVAPLLAE